MCSCQVTADPVLGGQSDILCDFTVWDHYSALKIVLRRIIRFGVCSKRPDGPLLSLPPLARVLATSEVLLLICSKESMIVGSGKLQLYYISFFFVGSRKCSINSIVEQK